MPCYIDFYICVLHRKVPQETVDMMEEEIIGNLSNQRKPETAHPSHI